MVTCPIHIGLIGVSCCLVGVLTAAEEAPLRLRMENFTVMPSTGPVVNVLVENRGDREVGAVVRVQWPEGWKGAPAAQKVDLQPGKTTKAAFTIEKAIDVAANRYPIKVEATTGNQTVTRTQQVVCATAPYLKPQLDGKLDDWKDAVPVTFSTGGRKTTVMTCWNRKQFCMAVRAEQMKGGAVQFALAPGVTDEPGRFEWVVVAPEADERARCYLLFGTGDDQARAERLQSLDWLGSGAAQARVTRDGTATLFEIVVPLKSLPGLRPMPGREFRFSALVHTPDGLRDLGSVMNLGEDRRSPRSWCRWDGAKFGSTPPFDSNVEFGFSSSIH